jgi:hypothetical protein
VSHNGIILHWFFSRRIKFAVPWFIHESLENHEIWMSSPCVICEELEWDCQVGRVGLIRSVAVRGGSRIFFSPNFSVVGDMRVTGPFVIRAEKATCWHRASHMWYATSRVVDEGITYHYIWDPNLLISYSTGFCVLFLLGSDAFFCEFQDALSDFGASACQRRFFFSFCGDKISSGVWPHPGFQYISVLGAPPSSTPEIQFATENSRPCVIELSTVAGHTWAAFRRSQYGRSLSLPLSPLDRLLYFKCAACQSWHTAQGSFSFRFFRSLYFVIWLPTSVFFFLSSSNFVSNVTSRSLIIGQCP